MSEGGGAGSGGHPARLAAPWVQSLSPYVPGKPISELERELGLHDIVKLASNENPSGPSPRALEAMRRALEDVWLYPDGTHHELRQALASHLGVDVRCVTVGNGSNDLLVLLAQAFLTPGCSAVYAQYGFSIYPIVIHAAGARAIEVPAPANVATGHPLHEGALGQDPAALCRAIRPDTRLVFIANPNNPTGAWANAGALEALVAQAPASTLVIVDEAYLEYGRLRGTQDALPWLARYPNLVILRTFSKAYGLAGARVGYAVSHPEVADVLNRLRPAFNVNSLALSGAVAALADQPYMRGVAEQTMQELARVQQALEQLGVRFVPSAANFVLLHAGTGARRVYQDLLAHGLIVRPVEAYGLPEWLRVSIGLRAHNDLLLRLLPEALGRSRAPA